MSRRRNYARAGAMKAILLLLWFVALSSAAAARINETLAECEARYGKADKAGERSEFLKGDIAIVAHFGKDGKCDYIFFTAHDILARRQFTEAERGGLLKANNLGGLLVRRKPIEGGEIEWETASKSVTAVMVSKGSRIVFYTPDGKRALDAHLEAESKKEPSSIKGF